MKKETLLEVGIVGVGVIAGVACYKNYKTNTQLNELLKNMDKLSDGVDIDIDEKLVNVAVKNAADKAAKVATTKAVNDIVSEINASVSESVKEAVGDISPTIQAELEKQISMVDISEIKKEVVKKTAGMVAENISIPKMFTSSGSSSEVSDIIKYCTEAGMASWEIEKILNSIKK